MKFQTVKMKKKPLSKKIFLFIRTSKNGLMKSHVTYIPFWNSGIFFCNLNGFKNYSKF
jgi:hypothetical protein